MATDIQWTDETWNPVTGCSRVSPGCANCYIERTPPFRMQGRRFARVGNEETTGVRLHADRLEQPLRWRKPRRVFVCSLADLFHDDVPDSYIDDVFAAMLAAPQHTFQVLTKRPDRAREWFESTVSSFDTPTRVWTIAANVLGATREHGGWPTETWPIPNVWLGVSIENARYTWRADVLREIPAAVRFISAEPLLGSLYLEPAPSRLDRAELAQRPRRGRSAQIAPAIDDAAEGGTDTRGRAALDLTGIDWIIVGGESGPGARPFHLEHAREIIREARSLPFIMGDNPPAIFVKQLGAKPVESGERYAARVAVGVECDHGYDVCPECDAADVELTLRDRKGGDMDEWPADLRVREFPRPAVAA